MEADIPNDGCKIIYCYWTKFSKYRVLSMATRSIICRSLRLRHIIDLQDTNKSRYFGITEFNNFFIIQSSSFFFFLINFFGKLPFSHKSDCKKEKSVISFIHEQNIICSQTQLDDVAQEQTIICRKLFVGHVVSSRLMKRKKNCHRVIIPLFFNLKLYSCFRFELIPYMI